MDPWLPVTGVSAEDAAAFCAWLVEDWEWQGRPAIGDLPTELEWEQAVTWAPGFRDDLALWPWGDQPELERANIARASEGVAPVATWPAGASPAGSEDLVGNVAEWVRAAARGPAADPLRPAESGFLLAGGSWRTSREAILASLFEAPGEHRPLDDVGFRCIVRSDEPR